MGFFSNCTTTFIGVWMKNLCAQKTHKTYSATTSTILQKKAPRNQHENDEDGDEKNLLQHQQE